MILFVDPSEGIIRSIIDLVCIIGYVLHDLAQFTNLKPDRISR